MTEQELASILDIVRSYFRGTGGEEATIGIPFLRQSGAECFDFTGLIGVSGSRKGGIFLTAERGLLLLFGQAMLGDEELDDDALHDLVGEMTNTIAGNMRERFGPSFLISVPMVIRGRIEEISMRLRPPVYVVPMEWRGSKCRLALGLE